MPEVSPKNQTNERFEPDYLHRITFGNPPRNSLPAQLVAEHEWVDVLRSSGRFVGIKRTIEITNKELYAYLRLGVSTQSVSHLKWMGYPTPESLTESEVTAALLPDHLGRLGGKYPMKFIDACEQEGVSAVVCQLAIRRGITERHLEGGLSLSDLLYAFTNLVNKNVVSSEGREATPSLINYVCDGTIPLDFVKDVSFTTPALIAVASNVLLADDKKELSSVLLGDKTTFRRFVRSVGSGRSPVASIEGLHESINTYGYKILELEHPLLCAHKFGKGEDKRVLGYGAAKYTESLAKASPSAASLDELHYVGYGDDVRISRRQESASWYSSVRVSFADIYALHEEGIDPSVAYKHVVEDEMPVDSLITAHRDGIQTSLMSGAL